MKIFFGRDENSFSVEAAGKQQTHITNLIFNFQEVFDAIRSHSYIVRERSLCHNSIRLLLCNDPIHYDFI